MGCSRAVCDNRIRLHASLDGEERLVGIFGVLRIEPGEKFEVQSRESGSVEFTWMWGIRKIAMIWKWGGRY